MSDYTLKTMRDAIDASCFQPSATTDQKNTVINKFREMAYFTPFPDVAGTHWRGLDAPIEIAIVDQPDDSQTITLPRGAMTLIGQYYSGGIQRIRNQWYSFLRNAPTTPIGGPQMDDMGEGFCGVSDLPAAGATIKVTTTSNEGGGKTLTIYGTDVNGNPISEALAIPTVSGTTTTGSTTFYSVTQVVKSAVTAGDLIVNQTTAAVDTFFARYQPGELSPNYRRYRFNQVMTDETVVCMVARKYYPLSADNDPCEIGSVLAFENGLKAYRWQQNNDLEASKKSLLLAVGYLNGELARYEGETALMTVQWEPYTSGGAVWNIP